MTLQRMRKIWKPYNKNMETLQQLSTTVCCGGSMFAYKQPKYANKYWHIYQANTQIRFISMYLEVS